MSITVLSTQEKLLRRLNEILLQRIPNSLFSVTRAVCKERKWCGTVHVIEREKNIGMAASIIEGFSEVVNKFGRAIEIEDDVATGKYFLEYMNDALDRYENDKQVMHIKKYKIFPYV